MHAQETTPTEASMAEVPPTAESMAASSGEKAAPAEKTAASQATKAEAKDKAKQERAAAKAAAREAHAAEKAAAAESKKRKADGGSIPRDGRCSSRGPLAICHIWLLARRKGPRDTIVRAVAPWLLP